MMKNSFLHVCILVFAVLIMTSCDRQMVFDDFQHIDEESWQWEAPADFIFSMEDTATFHNILIRLRHTTDYPLSNLYMFVHLEGPSGQTMTDTINFILAENSGKWIGKGVGNIREIGYLYKRNARFPEQGEYQISIEQAMRLPELPVSQVGVRIERVNP